MLLLQSVERLSSTLRIQIAMYKSFSANQTNSHLVIKTDSKAQTMHSNYSVHHTYTIFFSKDGLRFLVHPDTHLFLTIYITHSQPPTDSMSLIIRSNKHAHPPQVLLTHASCQEELREVSPMLPSSSNQWSVSVCTRRVSHTFALVSRTNVDLIRA
jgi:hypothetical protein